LANAGNMSSPKTRMIISPERMLRYHMRPSQIYEWRGSGVSRWHAARGRCRARQQETTTRR
jgi:hypothetical protein